MTQNSNKTIAKNTFFMYFRMALITLVGLYSARVILNVLGVVDYGIYNVAGSVVAMFGFLNGALATSSARFITIELGKQEIVNSSSITRCFTTTRGIHGILAIIVLLIAETVGLWVLNTKCEIPPERITAAAFVYQISVLTSMLSITLAPYEALIIAHEHLSIYAYLGIADALLKLLICYLIYYSPIDNLIFYAILLFLIQLGSNLFCRIYCSVKFHECSLKYSLDRVYLKPILGFSGWSLLGSFSYMSITQATTIILSFFFGPAIVAAKSVASQVRNYILSFINNFRVAVNPQILKRHAAGDLEGSKNLILFSTSLSFYLMLLVLLPILFEADFLLDLWLNNKPDYVVDFTRLTVLELLTGVYGASFYMIFQAYGRLKENAIICPITDIITIIIVCIIYYNNGPVLTVAWALLLLSIIQCCFIKPLLAVKLFGYQWRDFCTIFARNFVVLVSSSVFPFIIYILYDNLILGKVLVMISSILGVLFFSYLWGFSNDERKKISGMVNDFFVKVKIRCRNCSN